MQKSLYLLRIAVLALLPLLVLSPQAPAGFIPTLHNLSAEGAQRLEATRSTLENKIVLNYLKARGKKDDAAATAVAAMNDEQRRKTIDQDIPKYKKGIDASDVILPLALLALPVLVLASLGSHDHDRRRHRH